MDTNYNKLLNNLTDLKLERMKDNLPQYIDMINSGNKTIVDALYELTEKEKSFKKEKAIKACVMTAGFPFHKTLDDYDFSFQPGINKKEIEDYMTLRFIDIVYWLKWHWKISSGDIHWNRGGQAQI